MINMARKLDITFKSKDTLKVKELNQILDKINSDNDLTEREIEFLDKFDSIKDDELQDFNYLSLLDLFYLLSKIDKIIMCDIKDRHGKINDQILSLQYNHDECQIILGLKHGNLTLKDNCFYKLSYQFRTDTYSLDVQDEYNEKIILD